MGRKTFHIIHTRSFQGFFNKDNSQVLFALTAWLARYGFKCKLKNNEYSTGKESGINVNNIAKFKLHVSTGINNSTLVTLEHYAKLKIRTYLAIGALTLGVSTGIGMGTLELIQMESDNLVRSFWRFADTIAIIPGIVVHMKRWVRTDGRNGDLFLASSYEAKPASIPAYYFPIQTSPQPPPPIKEAALDGAWVTGDIPPEKPKMIEALSPPHKEVPTSPIASSSSYSVGYAAM